MKLFINCIQIKSNVRFFAFKNNYWGQIDSQKAFFTFAAKKLKINNLDDWYQVRNSDFK